mgnify:CR=1 FL=1
MNLSTPPDELLIRAETHARLHRVMELVLDFRERAVLQGRYGWPRLTHKTLAENWHVSRQRVQHIEQCALRKLRRCLSRAEFRDDYLAIQVRRVMRLLGTG